LVACYGVEENHVRWGSSTSVWWKDLYGVRERVGLNVGNWFYDNMVNGFFFFFWKELANKENSLFLHDWWLKGGPLCNWFRRLFELTEIVMCMLKICVG